MKPMFQAFVFMLCIMGAAFAQEPPPDAPAGKSAAELAADFNAMTDLLNSLQRGRAHVEKNLVAVLTEAVQNKKELQDIKGRLEWSLTNWLVNAQRDAAAADDHTKWALDNWVKAKENENEAQAARYEERLNILIEWLRKAQHEGSADQLAVSRKQLSDLFAYAKACGDKPGCFTPAPAPQ